MNDQFQQELKTYTIRELKLVADYYDLELPKKAVKEKIILLILERAKAIEYGEEKNEIKQSVRVKRIAESMVK